MKKKGISLITLAITIVVLIILVSIVILSFGKNSPLDSARVAVLSQTEDSINSAVHNYTSKVRISTIGVYDSPEIILGLLANTNEYKIIDDEYCYINDDLTYKLLYKLDKNKVKEKLDIDLKNPTNKSDWYIDNYGKAYLVFDTKDDVISYLKEGDEILPYVSWFVKYKDYDDRLLLAISSDSDEKTNKSLITYTFTFSSIVTGFDESDITVVNGTKGEFKKLSEIQYSLTVTNEGSCNQFVSVQENACENTKNIGNNAAVLGVLVDRDGPVLQSLEVISPAPGEYLPGEVITFLATYDEDIYNNGNTKISEDLFSAITLKLRFGSGEERIATTLAADNTTIIYQYELQDGDEGNLIITEYTGTVYDEFGNEGIINKTGSFEGNVVSGKIRQNGEISFANSTVSKEYGDSMFMNVLTNTGDGIVTYTSSNESVATIDESGIVTVLEVGTTTISATVTDTENYKYATKTASYTLTVNLSDYNIVYDLDGGTLQTANPTTYNRKSNFTLNNPIKTGYVFAGWTGSNGDTPQLTVTISNTTGNKSYTANWNAATNTAYKVIHKKMNLDGNGYSVYETENLTGTTGASITPSTKTYTGFNAPSTKTVTISADGSTEVEYLYVRNQYRYTLSSGTGTITTGSSATGNYYYGATITLKCSADDGYENAKWTSSNTTLVASPSSLNTTFTMPAGNITMTSSAAIISYSVTLNANGGTVSPNSKTVTYRSEYGELPIPSKDKCIFTGWFTSSSGGTEVTSTTIVDSKTAHSLWAHWTDANYEAINKSGVKKYFVTLEEAFKYSNLATVNLLRNTTESKTSSIRYEGSNTITLDLGNYTLNVFHGISNFTDLGTMTIQNGTINLTDTEGHTSISNVHIMYLKNVTINANNNGQVLWNDQLGSVYVQNGVILNNSQAANVIYNDGRIYFSGTVKLKRLSGGTKLSSFIFNNSSYSATTNVGSSYSISSNTMTITK